MTRWEKLNYYDEKKCGCFNELHLISKWTGELLMLMNRCCSFSYCIWPSGGTMKNIYVHYSGRCWAISYLISRILVESLLSHLVVETSTINLITICLCAGYLSALEFCSYLDKMMVISVTLEVVRQTVSDGHSVLIWSSSLQCASVTNQWDRATWISTLLMNMSSSATFYRSMIHKYVRYIKLRSLLCLCRWRRHEFCNCCPLNAQANEARRGRERNIAPVWRVFCYSSIAPFNLSNTMRILLFTVNAWSVLVRKISLSHLYNETHFCSHKFTHTNNGNRYFCFQQSCVYVKLKRTLYVRMICCLHLAFIWTYILLCPFFFFFFEQ